MKKSLSLLMIPLLILPAAYATTPAQVTGSFTVASETVTGVRTVDGNLIISLTAVFDFTGPLTGSFVADFTIVAKPTGEQTFQATGTYSGAVGGSSGSFDFNFVGSIEGGTAAQGHLTILGGTGGLTNLHGELDLMGTVGVGGTYSGEIHFDPS